MWLTATTEMLGDATCWYKVDGIPEGLTLSEAIKWIGDLTLDAHGHISVKEDGDGTYSGNEVARYGSFGVESSDNDRLDRLSDREVEKILANGGWGQLHFEIKLKKLTI